MFEKSNMPDLNLLQTFVAFSKAKNIQEAARVLRCSQSTVTLHLQRLEAEVGVPLFFSEGKKKVLSQEGQRLLGALEPRLEELTGALASVKGSLASPRQLRLRLGGRREVLSRIASGMQFAGTLELVFLSESESQQRFLAGTLDMVVVHEKNLFSPQVYMRKLFTSTSKLLVRGDLLSGRSIPLSLCPELILGLPALTYSAADFRILAVCRKLGLNPDDVQVGAQAEDWPLLIEWVERGWGYCIAPDTYAPRPGSGIQELEIPPSVIPGRTFYLAYKEPVRSMIQRQILKLDLLTQGVGIF